MKDLDLSREENSFNWVKAKEMLLDEDKPRAR